MAGYNRNSYQYETSPRKLKPEYKVATKKRKKTVNKKVEKKKPKLQNNRKLKFQITVNAIFIFAILFGMIYQNAQISQSFSQIQDLKSQATEIQKENDQLEISIQNELNLSSIEENAKNMLGMQKLTSSQTRYVNLSKRDYVEPSTEEVIMNTDKNIFSTILEKIKNLF